MILTNTKKNKAFIHQVQALDELRIKLAEIPTHGDAQLMDKHRVTNAAIARALQKMMEHQLKLYESSYPNFR